MIHVVDFFTRRFGVGGNVLVALMFLAMAVVGVIIAVRGRGAMVTIVSVCGFLLGLLGGAMVGILCFDSLIAMIVLAAVGGVVLLFTVRNVKSIGYFIGIGSLSWFLAFVITSEMYVTDAKITENTLLFADLVIAVIMGFLAALRSKYTVSVVTSLAGGVMTSISILAMLGNYFADAKTWIIAGVVAVVGFIAQTRVYDLKPKRNKQKHRKKRR